MPRNINAPTKEEEKFNGLTGADFALTGLGGAASGALSGAALGTSVLPGLGTLGGALVGGGVGLAGGLIGASQQNKQLEEAFAQQQELTAELETAGQKELDTFLADQALASSLQRDQATTQARQAATRAGLTPAASVAFEQQAINEVNKNALLARPELFRAAEQVALQERGQVLNEVQTAQQLAEITAPGNDLQDALASSAAAAAQLAVMQGGQTAGTEVGEEAVRAGTTVAKGLQDQAAREVAIGPLSAPVSQAGPLQPGATEALAEVGRAPTARVGTPSQAPVVPSQAAQAAQPTFAASPAVAAALPTAQAPETVNPGAPPAREFPVPPAAQQVIGQLMPVSQAGLNQPEAKAALTGLNESTDFLTMSSDEAIAGGVDPIVARAGEIVRTADPDSLEFKLAMEILSQ